MQNAYNNVILGFDFISFILLLVCLVFFLKQKVYRFSSAVKCVLLAIIVLNLFHSLSNVLEWAGITNALDALEEYVEIFIVTMWFFAFYISLRDIREKELHILKKNLELELKNKSQELLKLNRNLQEKKRLADIGSLAATVAHELRTPLAAIKAAVYNITKKNKEPALDKHLFNIDKKVSESDQIIENLLDYSKIKPPVKIRVNCCDMISECIKEYEQRHQGKGVRIIENCDCSGDLAVKIDQLQIRQVVSNLFNNALQSYENKAGDVFLDIKCNEKENSLRISVTDKGCGIKKQELHSIFEPFFTTKIHGTGLGLTLCKQIVNLHGGFISASSQEGKGTTILVDLPIS